jgi:hypothetical protein
MEMYPLILWELVADPKGYAEHTFGTTASDCLKLCFSSLFVPVSIVILGE